MNLSDFINAYDFIGSIVLLEGKRKVNPSDKNSLILLGELLATRTKYIKFRSGNAPGADELFCKGISLVDNKRIELIIPDNMHRRKNRNGIEAISLDEINLLNEPEIVYQSKSNNKTRQLIDRYVNGYRDNITIKAGYIIRDTIKVLGIKGIHPASFGIFYDDLENPQTGGTGHTMKICELNNIPIINQCTWKKWLV